MISTAPAAMIAMPAFLGIFLSLLLEHHCPAESNEGNTGAAKHPNRPIELTGLDQALAVRDGHDSAVGRNAVGRDIAPGNVGLKDAPVAVSVEVFPMVGPPVRSAQAHRVISDIAVIKRYGNRAGTVLERVIAPFLYHCDVQRNLWIGAGIIRGVGDGDSRALGLVAGGVAVDRLLLDRPGAVRIELIEGVGPVVRGVEHLSGPGLLAVLEQLDGDAVIGVAGVAVAPVLGDGELGLVEAVHTEHPVDLTDAVGIPVVKRDGHVQINGECGALALIELADKDVIGQSPGLVGSAFIDLRAAGLHRHGELREEVGHRRDGLIALTVDFGLILAVGVLKGLAVGEGVCGLVMGNCLHVEIHKVAVRGVLRSIGEADALGQVIAGHDVLEAVKQVGRGIVHVVGPEPEALLLTAERDGSGGRRSRRKRADRHAHEHEHHEHEGCDRFE